jgi:predicted nucleic acid-binding protein
VVPFDVQVARVHAEIWAQLASRGDVVGERDLMIAATAISIGYSLATRDRGLSKVPGLSIELW